MADKKILLGIIIGVGLVMGLALIPFQTESAIPPTRAFQNIHLNDTNATVGVWYNSSAYNSPIYIITDGSIVFNTTQGQRP